MGNGHSLPMAGQEAQEELRAIQPEMIPTTQSDVVRATEEAEEPKARELAISAQLFHINPRMIEFSMIEAVVRRGCEYTLYPDSQTPHARGVSVLSVRLMVFSSFVRRC